MNLNKTTVLTPYLKGVGQIMLQNNQWTGILFLSGIFYDSIIMGIAAVLAVVVGTLTAKVLKYNEDEINMGLYGFSATLVGVALMFHFEDTSVSSPVIWGTVVVGSALATILQHFFISRKIPAFTFPFIVVTWVCLYLFHSVFHIESHLIAQTTTDLTDFKDDLAVFAHGYGEVIFQASIIAGILFFIAVFVEAPVAALYGMFGSVVSATIAHYLDASSAEIHIGLFSFNAVLCAITFSGTKKIDGLYVLLSVVLAVMIEEAMETYHLAILTFPFVAASWITLLVKKAVPQ